MTLSPWFADLAYLAATVLGDVAIWIGAALVTLAFVDGVVSAIQIVRKG